MNAPFFDWRAQRVCEIDRQMERLRREREELLRPLQPVPVQPWPCPLPLPMPVMPLIPPAPVVPFTPAVPSRTVDDIGVNDVLKRLG